MKHFSMKVFRRTIALMLVAAMLAGIVPEYTAGMQMVSARAEIETPAPAEGTEPASAEGTEPAPAEGTEPAPVEGTEPAPAEGTEPAPAEGTELAPVEGTEPAPAEGTEPAPAEGTEPAPAEGTEPAPVEGTEPAPAEGTEPAPVEGTEPAPVEGTEPAPVEGTEPAPAEGTEPAPAEGTEPAPEEGTEPAPAEGTEPAPAEGTEPAPAEGTEPAPAEGTEPAPVEGTELAPVEGTEPAPVEGTEPAPAEGTEPEPVEGTEPAPVEGTEPEPAEGTEPAPAEGTEPAPVEGTEPEPVEGTEPAPAEDAAQTGDDADDAALAAGAPEGAGDGAGAEQAGEENAPADLPVDASGDEKKADGADDQDDHIDDQDNNTEEESAQEIIPIEEEKPAQEIIPIEEEKPAQEIIPIEEEKPAQEIIPIEEEKPIQQIESAAGAALPEKGAPVDEARALRAAAPVAPDEIAPQPDELPEPLQIEPQQPEPQQPAQALNAAGESDVLVEEAPMDAAEILPVTPAPLPEVEENQPEGDAKVELQEKINDLIGGLTKLAGKLTLVLNKDVTSAGDVTIAAAEGQEVADDFVLELAAEDAGDDGAQADGTTVVDGNVTIKGLKVLMKGVLLAMKRQIKLEDGAQLEYTGTDTGNTVQVEVGKDSSAKIATGAGADTVTVLTLNGAKSTEIATGAGPDTVNATTQGGTLDVATGDGADTINLNIEAGAGKVTVDAGAGDNRLNVIDKGAEAELAAGAGDDTIALDVQNGTGDVAVKTGAGADTVSVNNGDSLSGNQKIADGQGKALTIENQGDTNHVVIDTSVSDVLDSIEIKGNEKGDKVHLVGSLSSDTEADKRIVAVEGGFKLVGANKLSLTIAGEPANHFTDALSNKQTVELSPSGSKFTFAADKAFVNYVIKTPVSGIGDIVIDAKDGKTLTLTNLIIDTEKTLDKDDTLTLKNLSAKGLNLILRGKTININGNVYADNVLAEASSGTRSALADLNFDGFSEAIDGLKQAAADLISVYDKAEINVARNAGVYSLNDITLNASVNHFGGILTVAPGLNVVNVKVGSAAVNVLGTIQAGGFTQNGKEYKGSPVGTVRIASKVNTTFGQGVEGYPLAVSVVLDDAKVNIGDRAHVYAPNDINISAENTASIETNATSGLFGAPFAIAVNVLTSDVKANVAGRLTGRNITVSAKGNIDAAMRAGKGGKQKSISGVYAAVNVIDQDVKANVAGTARINASGKFRLNSVANANATTTATVEKAEDSGDSGSFSLGDLLGGVKKIWDPVKEKLSSAGKSGYQWVADKLTGNTIDKKLEKLLGDTAKGNYSIKVMENADNDKKGSVSLTTDTSLDKLNVTVKVTPKAGYTVKSVKVRYLEPGKSGYTYDDNLVDKGDGEYSYICAHPNAEVVVAYDGSGSGDEGEDSAPASAADAGDEDDDNGLADLFAQGDEDEDAPSVAGLFNDATEGASDSAEDDEDIFGLGDLFDEDKASKLTIENSKMKDGKIVTYLEDKEGESLASVAPGQKVMFVPNPDKGKQLDTLTVKYHATIDGKDTVKTDTVAADKQGRYVFTVPESLIGTYGLNVNATFKDKDPEKEDKTDNTNTQVTGAVAVAVVLNDNDAIIEDGAIVNAGSVAVQADELTNAVTTADGTAAGKPDEKKEEKPKDEEPKLKIVTDSKYSIDAARYALRLNGYDKDNLKQSFAENKYTYEVNAGKDKPDKVLFSYVKDGKRETEEIKADADGKYVIDSTKIGDGSVADVSFIYPSKDGELTTTGETYQVRNPINVTWNAASEKDPKDDKKTVKNALGKVEGAQKDGKFVFTVSDIRKGYKLEDANFTASFVDLAGKAQKVPLTKNADGKYELDVSGMKTLPAGAVITVNAQFTEDLRKVSTDDKDKDKGKVTVSKENAKAGDKVTVALQANTDYSATGVKVTYKNKDGKEQTIDATRGEDGKYSFEVPEGVDEKEGLKVAGQFAANNVNLKVASGNDKDVKFTTTGRVAKGQEIGVAPSDGKVKDGWKVSKVTISYVKEGDNRWTEVACDGASFKVPDDIKDVGNTTELRVNVTLAQKDIDIPAETKVQNGRLTPVSQKADAGDTVAINVKPDDGYRLKKGTLKAEINTGSGSSQIVLNRVSDTQYSFTLPSDTAKDAKITFVAEFEEGQADSSKVNTSVGVSVAVGIALGNNDAAIRGGNIITSKGDVQVAAATSGKAETTAKAGYSAGNIGVGGAIAVQLASADTRALVGKSDKGGSINAAGNLTVTATGNQSFGVTGDASGSSKVLAAKAGVGAGIAVGVNGADAVAAIEDGVTLDADKPIAGIAVSASQKTADKVTAKAGATGGVSVVPVLALDIIGTSATASLGKLKDGAQQVSGVVSVEANNASKHTVQADASSAGGSTALGGAFAISVIGDGASASLKQSVNAKSVAVTAIGTGETTEKAVAGVSGGVKGKKDQKGASGSTDKQVDKVIGSGAKLADKNKSKNMSPDKLTGQTGDRQKAQTSEGSVAGAGAVAVNVQKNRTSASIADGADIRADGKVSVTATNRTVAQVSANASTTKSDIGVGIGVGVNIVTVSNTASIGDGAVSAGELEVAARMPEAAGAGVTAEEKVEEKKAEDGKGFEKKMRELAEKASGKLFEAMGLGQNEFLTSLQGTFAETFTKEILSQPELAEVKKFLDGGDYEKKVKAAYDKIKAKFETMTDNMSDAVVKVINQAVDTADMTEAQIQALVDEVMAIAQEDILAKSADTVSRMLENAGNRMVNATLEMVEDGLAGNGWSLDKLTRQIQQSLSIGLKELGDGIVGDTVERLKPHLPLMTAENLMYAVEELTDTVENELKDFVSFADETFKSDVFNYQDLIDKFAGKDLKEYAEKHIREALKKSSVAVTNEMLDKALGKLDVGVEKPEQEDLTDKHVVTTEAVSGAGAKDVGVAGSVAVAVVNMETKATVAGGDKDFAVTGLTAVDAQENRRVRTVASSAVDDDGDADANDGAGKSKGKDTGNSAKKTIDFAGNKLHVQTGAGGSSTFDNQAQVSNPRVLVDVEDGYKTPEKATYKYTDSKGEEQTGEVKIEKDGRGQLYFRPYYGSGVKDNDTTFTVEFEEDLKQLPTVGTSEIGPTEVKLSVEDREAEDGKWSARAGDVVKVKVPKMDGVKLTGLTYTIDGKAVNITQTAGGNADETVYIFKMPVGEISSIDAYFDWDDTPEEEKETASESESENESGQSVGVGASFAFVYGDSAIEAVVGARDVRAGTLSVTAASDHAEKTSAVAGTDPLEDDEDDGDKKDDKKDGDDDDDDDSDAKDIAVDASIAVNALDTRVRAILASGATVETTDDSGEAIETEKNDDGEDEATFSAGDMRVTATEEAETENKASSFATGNNTAVGASVAVNVASSDIRAEVNGDADVAGAASIAANSHSEDNTAALASAMGSDIQRNLDKVKGKVKSTKDSANKLLDGSYLDEKAKDKDEKKNSENDTAKKLNKKLDDKKDKEGEDSSTNLSLSSNALRSQNTKTQDASAGNEGGSEAEKQIKDATGVDVDATKDGEENRKFQVAAAVGVSVTDHEAHTTVSGSIIAGKGVSATAENTGNFNTLGTGAAMSLAERANSIAAGVAVSVNQNKALVDVDGDVVAGEGDVELTSKLTQNMDGEYPNKLAAQSLAGSVAGKKSDVSIAAAISTVVSQAESKVNVTGGTTGAERRIEGQNITVEATDKSKLAARAGGVSYSKGSSVGMGVAATVIVSGNEVVAAVGDNTAVKGNSFKLNAEKQAVTFDDYDNKLSLRKVISDSSGLSDEERENADTGLIDIHKGKDEKNYTIDVNLSSDSLLGAVDALNVLSAQNTYAEAIAGSVISGGGDGGKLSLAGSFAVATMNNTIRATMGDNVKVSLTKGEDDGQDGSMTVNAKNEATARVIAGSISAAASQASVGATVAVMVDNNDVLARTGDDMKVEAEGDVTQAASDKEDVQLFTAAASVAHGSKAKVAAGGAVNVIVVKNVAASKTGKDASVKAGGSASVTSDSRLDLMAISLSANLTSGKVAAGGTVNVIVDKTQAVTQLGENNAISAGKDVKVASKVDDQLISGTASASVAPSGSAAVAGVVNVLVSQSRANTTLGAGAKLDAGDGDLAVTADSDAWMLNAGLAASGAKGVAVGGAINVNVFNRDASVNMTDGSLTAGRNVLAQANAKDSTILAGLTVAGSASGPAAVSGNVIALVENSKVQNNIAEGMIVNAKGSAVLESHYSDFNVIAGGSIAATGGTAAVGATVLTAVKNNDIRTTLAKSTVNAFGESDAVKARSGDSVQGVYVGANAKETEIMASAGVAVAGTAGVTGTINTLVNNNKVIADASEADMSQYTWKYDKMRVEWQRPNQSSTYSYSTYNMAQFMTIVEKLKRGEEKWVRYVVDGKKYYVDVNDLTFPLLRNYNSNVTVKATDDTHQTVIAGGVNVGGSAGVGASVVTVVSNKDVEALAHDMSAKGDINVSADNQDKIIELAVSAGIGGTASVQVGAAIQVLKSKAIARVASDVTSAEGNLNVTANNDAKLINSAVAVGGAGAAAVTPVGVVTYFQGEADARLASGTNVKLSKGTANVSATGNKDVNLYAIGAAAGGAAGISGTANVLVSKDSTKAVVETGATVNAGGDINVNAQSDYKLRSTSASIGAAGTAGVAVNGIVSVMKGNTIAEIAGEAVSGSGVNVKASGARDVINAGATVGGGGVAGVGVTVMVLVAGEKMSQDAADMLAYGRSDSKDGPKSFDADKFLKAAGDSGADVSDLSDLNEQVSGNGHYESESSVGGSTGSGADQKGTFDATSGMRSSDYDNKDFDDQGDAQRGENAQIDETGDVSDAKNLNTYSYTGDPQDAVIARITQDAMVTANAVSVIAEQPTTADLYGATAAVGGMAGVGVSTAVALLRSNVSATSMGKVALTGGGMTVQAISRAGEAENNADEQSRASALKATLGDKLDPTKRTIRTVALTASGGTVGVGVAASVVLTDNVTQAIVGGSVKDAASMTVNAQHKYDNVLAATAALGGGLVSVNASVAVAQANGAVTAAIDKGAKISTKSGNGGLSVTTESDVGVNAIAATAGAGGVAVNGGVALATNRLTQNTEIREGAAVNHGGSGDLLVKGKAATAANAYLLGVSAGGVGVLLNGAVTNVAAQLNTRVGSDEGEKVKLSATEATVDVRNDIESSSTPQALSVAAGGVAVGGNVLLAFNETRAEAKVARTDMKAKNLKVVSDLQGAAASKLDAATVGAIAVGVSVNYADMNASNAASVNTDDSTFDISGDMTVRTGETDHDNTSAVAETVAGNAGAISVGLNAAVARNRAKNIASITGKNALSVGGTLTMRGYDKTTASAQVTGAQISGVSVAASFGIALNEADTRTELKLPYLNAGKVDLSTYQKGETNAKLLTGGGALIGVTASVATAYGRSKSTIDVELNKESNAKGGFSAKNEASDSVVTTVANQSFGGITANALVGTAFAQDAFKTSIKLPMKGGALNVSDGDFNATTDYTANATADVTPSAGGISASWIGVDVTAAAAKSTAVAESTVKGNAQVTARSANIGVTGNSSTNAKVNTPDLAAGVVRVNANAAISLLKTAQIAAAIGDDNLRFNGPLTVTSTLNDNGNDHALANIGGTGGGASLSKYDIKANVAVATADASSTARAENAQTVNAGGDMNVRSAGQSNAKASVGADSEVSVVGVGLNVLYTKANGTFDALVNNAKGARMKNLNVNSEYSAAAKALGGVSNAGTGSASLASVKVNVAEAIVGTQANAKLTNSVIDQIDGNLSVTAKGNSVAAQSSIGSAKIDLSGVKVAANVSQATAGATQNAEINGLTINGGGSGGINVDSTLSADTNATVGTTGGDSISLLNVQASTATADSNATAAAKISGLKMDRSGSNVTVNANLAKDKAYADVVNGLNVSLANVGVVVTSSDARGTVRSELIADNANFRSGDVNVTAGYDADSDAVVKATGNTIGGFNGSFNTATTDTRVNATAKLVNDSSYLAFGNLKVVVNGKVASDADAQTPTWSIGFGNVAANRSTANANVNQTAAVENRKGGIMARGEVNVLSQISDTHANATVGSPANSRSVGLIDGAVNRANAYEKVNSTASVTGANALLSAGRTLNVKSVANNTTQANATSKAASSNGLITAGNLEVNAYTGDSFTVRLEGMELKSESGDVNIQAYANSRAYGKGVAPGGYSAVNGSSSKVYSGVGDGDRSPQTVQIVMGKNTLLTAGGTLNVKAENYGSAESKMESKSSYSIGSVASSSVPTTSYYKTLIEVGEGSVLTGKSGVNMLTKDKGGARSDVDADGMGLVLSLADMQGKNNLTSTNRLKLANDTAVGSDNGTINIQAQSSAEMYARSRYMGGFGIIGGNDVVATNTLNRTASIELGDRVKMTASKGGITIWTETGADDNIETRAEVQGSGVLSRGQAFARTYITSEGTTRVGQGGNLWANGDLKVWSEAKLNRVDTRAYSETNGLGVNPHSEAYAEIRNKAFVKLNENAGDMLYLTSNSGDASVRATGWTTKVYNYADARGSAAAGGSYALADIWVDILHHVYLDKTQISAKKEVLIHAINSEGGESYLSADAYAKMYAAGGYVQPIARLRGSIVNEIRSRRSGGGYEDYLSGSSIRHYAQWGNQGIDLRLNTDYSRIYVPVWYISGGHWKHVWAFIYVWVPEWSKYEISTTIDMSERNNWLGYGSARDDLANGRFGSRYANVSATDINALAKALATTIGSGAVSNAMKGVWKAKFDEEMNKLAGELFVLDVKAILEKDVRLDKPDLSRYWLWNNTVTHLDTYMLPNATRLNAAANGALRYVVEVMEGDVLGDGVSRRAHIVTALTQKAFEKPVVEVNRTTTLDFSDGTLRIEEQDDFDLNLSDISGKWLVEQLASETFQVIAVTAEDFENHKEGDALPTGEILTGITEGGNGFGGTTVYWIGRTPEEADDDTPLYALLVNPATDEVDAFRVTRNSNDTVDLSMMVYRDSKSDRRGEIRYNIMLYETGEENVASKFEVITDVLMGRELYTPAKLNVILRAVDVQGADAKGYLIGGDLFALDNGVDGVVNVMNGGYTATFDGDVFESEYTRIEGCSTGDLVITVKKDQPIWPEWDTEKTAHDIGDKNYELTDDGWVDVTEPEEDTPAQADDAETVAA